MPTRILVAGDQFVLNRLLVEALEEEVDQKLMVKELALPWPVQPFGPVAEVTEASGTEEQLVEALRDVDVCVTQMAPVSLRVLAASPSLRLVCVSRGGPVNVNLQAASRQGVVVTFAPGRNAVATAEHTVAMLLAALRRIPQAHGELMGGVWRGDHYRYDSVGGELEGSTVGLLGYGAIGRKVARILVGFGADVLLHDPYVEPAHVDAPARKVGLDELLSRSQVLSLHARDTPQTRGVIGRGELSRLPTGAVVVNCARGSLLDYEALWEALDSGHVAAAALDVFPEEPVPHGSRLFTSSNVVATPHVAGASRQTAHRAARIVAEDVGRFLRGEPPRYCANPDVLGSRRTD
jgi:D-3-phosphoglycerate dehydrogenase